MYEWMECSMNGGLGGWMDGRKTDIDKQVIWRVLLPPGKDLWRVGDQGVRLQHATTGKILTVTRCCSAF